MTVIGCHKHIDWFFYIFNWMKLFFCIFIALTLTACSHHKSGNEEDLKSHSNNTQYADQFIIVLDLQEHFYTDKQADISAKKLVETVNSLVDTFIPEKVIYVNATNKTLSISFKGISIDTLPVPAMDGNLKIVSNNIFTKYAGNAFTSAELNAFLGTNMAREIVLVGFVAEDCIYQTAIGGRDKGYTMYIIPEAIMGKSIKGKARAIKKMAKKGIKLLPIKEINSAL